MAGLILIGGISRSGKSSLAKYLGYELPNSYHIEQDNFVLHEDAIPKIKDRTNWEVPESIDWKKLRQHVSNCLSKFDHVILEGILAFTDTHLLEQANHLFYLNISKAEFLERRKKEGRWGDEPEWYLEYVWEAHQKYGLPISVQVHRFNNLEEKDYSKILMLIS